MTGSLARARKLFGAVHVNVIMTRIGFYICRLTLR
jgi:hypothetical protein